MSQSQNKRYKQTIYTQVLKSYQKLNYLMDQLTQPDLVQHCKIWKVEKGAKKLVDLVITGDKILTRSIKACKKASFAQKNQQDFLNSRKQNKTSKIQENECKREQYIIKNEDQASQVLKNYQDQSQGYYINNMNNFDIQIKQQNLLKYSSSELDFHKAESQKGKKHYSRGPYKNYSREMKLRMVQLYKQNAASLSKISAQYEVPIKNIKRWAQNGIDRKQGAGRKRLDPIMQKQLYQSITKSFKIGSTIQIDQIRDLALCLSNIPDFKASKGWVISFVQRFKLAAQYTIV